MLIVFEARMLIVLNCVRGLYYAGCFFPGKILNIFFLVYLRKFDYVLSSALLRKNPITFALRNVICIHCSYVLITRWCCIPTTHVVEWMCASCSLLIKCVGKRIRMMIRFWHWSRNVNRFWSTRVNRFEVRACVLSRSVLFSTEEFK